VEKIKRVAFISIKITTILIVTMTILLTLPGCWDYRGLNELETVVGVAVDMGSEKNTYRITFETVEYKKAGGTDSEFSPKLIESEGTTLFEAIRKAKIMLGNKLYFSHMQVIILSEQIAREKGLKEVLSWYSHDLEPRETSYIVISREESAAKLFEAKPFSTDFVSTEIFEIIYEDPDVYSQTINLPTYRSYDVLNSPGINLTLPVFRLVKNGNMVMVSSDGSAVFKEDKLTNYITMEDTGNLLFVLDEVSGGIISIDFNKDGQNDTSMEIKESKTKTKVKYDGNKVKVKIDIKSDVALGETPKNFDTFNHKEIKKLEEEAGKHLSGRIMETIKKAKEMGCDIFGFGNSIYKNSPKLWEKLKDKWEMLFKDSEVDITVKISIKNSGESK